jgi:hypothetical protein
VGELLLAAVRMAGIGNRVAAERARGRDVISSDFATAFNCRRRKLGSRRLRVCRHLTLGEIVVGGTEHA